MKNAKIVFLAALFLGTALPAAAQNVKITPLGSHDGELCPFDRALIFEDPDGTRIIYDVGRTVRGGSDPRLGKIDAVLLTMSTATISATRTNPPQMPAVVRSPTRRGTTRPTRTP